LKLWFFFLDKEVLFTVIIYITERYTYKQNLEEKEAE